MKLPILHWTSMPADLKKFQPDENQKENSLPSEYVRLEADLLSDSLNNESKELKKSILIYSRSHILLQEISDNLKSSLDPEVEVLSTFDRNVAIRLLESGE
jgi:hypothetical protein